MALFAVRIALEMRCNPKMLNTIYLAGLLHEVGKTAVPVEVLDKREALSRTGVAHRAALGLARFGKGSESRLLVACMVVAALLSAFMNNVGVAALLLPVVISIARKTGISASRLLMPLAVGALLGGMTTLIGTPPNIVIAEYRGSALGEPYRMFDFAPVGLAVAAVGVVYVALLGWRLIAAARGKHDAGKELFELASYVAEVVVPKGSATIGKLSAVPVTSPMSGAHSW